MIFLSKNQYYPLSLQLKEAFFWYMQNKTKYRTSLVSKSLPVMKWIFANRSISATKTIQYVSLNAIREAPGTVNGAGRILNPASRSDFYTERLRLCGRFSIGGRFPGKNLPDWCDCRPERRKPLRPLKTINSVRIRWFSGKKVRCHSCWLSAGARVCGASCGSGIISCSFVTD